MDTAQWAQGIGLVKKPMEEELVSTTTRSSPQQLVERKARPQKEQALNCPRCNSTNTKFCYYNNYSLTQPRYFCKTCRRYWTEGGSLRNVPVGGGSRKNKRHCSSSSSSTPSSTKNLPTDLIPPAISSLPTSQIHTKPYEGQDLNLAFTNHSLPEFVGFPNMESYNSTDGGGFSTMELLKSGITARGLGPLVQMPMPEASAFYGAAGFGLQDFRPSSIKFPLEGGIRGGGGGYASMQEGGGRLLFPFGDLKQVTVKTSDVDQNRGQGGDPPMFWNGMMGGGGGSW